LQITINLDNFFTTCTGFFHTLAYEPSLPSDF